MRFYEKVLFNGLGLPFIFTPPPSSTPFFNRWIDRISKEWCEKWNYKNRTGKFRKVERSTGEVPKGFREFDCYADELGLE